MNRFKESVYYGGFLLFIFFGSMYFKDLLSPATFWGSIAASFLVLPIAHMHILPKLEKKQENGKHILVYRLIMALVGVSPIIVLSVALSLK